MRSAGKGRDRVRPRLKTGWLCIGSGYIGRQGIYEVLVNSPAVAQTIKPQLNVTKVREVATNVGTDVVYSSQTASMAMPATVFGRTARRYAHLAVIDGGRQ